MSGIAVAVVLGLVFRNAGGLPAACRRGLLLKEVAAMIKEQGEAAVLY